MVTGWWEGQVSTSRSDLKALNSSNPIQYDLTSSNSLQCRWMGTSLSAWTSCWPGTSVWSTHLGWQLTGPLRTRWTFLVSCQLEQLWLCLDDSLLFCAGCQIFAYDHTISAPDRRGQNIHYFKTGLGFGENLKPLSQIIADNNHKNTVIDYLKVMLLSIKYSINHLNIC